MIRWLRWNAISFYIRMHNILKRDSLLLSLSITIQTSLSALVNWLLDRCLLTYFLSPCDISCDYWLWPMEFPAQFNILFWRNFILLYSVPLMTRCLQNRINNFKSDCNFKTLSHHIDFHIRTRFFHDSQFQLLYLIILFSFYSFL